LKEIYGQKDDDCGKKTKELYDDQLVLDKLYCAYEVTAVDEMIHLIDNVDEMEGLRKSVFTTGWVTNLEKLRDASRLNLL
jgi:hypothetical protein